MVVFMGERHEKDIFGQTISDPDCLFPESDFSKGPLRHSQRIRACFVEALSGVNTQRNSI